MDPQVGACYEILKSLHEDLFKAVEPLTDRDINWAHPHLSNTIGILLRHVAGSERYWIGEVVGGHPAHRDRPSEFVRDALIKAPLVEGLRSAYESVRAVLEELTDADLRREVEIPSRGGPRRVSKAWAVDHSLQHTAYHLGQIQLLRKMATSA